MTLLLAVLTSTAWAEKFITDVMLIGAETESEANSMIAQYQEEGWTIIKPDLNSGIKWGDGDGVYLLYKSEENTDGFNHGYITDFYLLNRGAANTPDNLTYNGRTYNLVPYAGARHFVGQKGDLNSHTSVNTDAIHLFYTNNVADIQRADIIVLPGTKATLDDLLELRRNGCAQAIQRAHRDGKMVIGICGGYQMLGQMVSDPDGIEGTITSLPGLGLLPIHTTMTPEKTTRQVTFLFEGQTCQGYEIHQGVSDTDQSVMQTGHCIGTYIHGFLDNAPVIDYLLSEKGTVNSEKLDTALSYADFKEEQYDKLAAHVRQYVDIDKIYEILRY